MSKTRARLTHDLTDSATIAASTLGQVVDMTSKGECVGLSVTNLGDSNFTIKVNSETNTHPVLAGKSWGSGPMKVTSFTIVEADANLYYVGAIASISS